MRIDSRDQLPPSLYGAVADLCQRGPRRLLGLAGAPGSGKSFLADEIIAAFPGQAVVVPMDGFHLAQTEIERLGIAHRKGAPDTFDVGGFVALLRRLRDPEPGVTVYAPAFRREIEDAIAGAIPVTPDVRLVVIEGNYLLMNDAWAPVRTLLDETWYVDTADELREEWLLQRHMSFGRSHDEAAKWIEHTDRPNAQLIAASKTRATRVVSWPQS